MAERPTFSPFWHRVRTLKPRLRPHVQITRQHYRGQRWHVVHDPATNQFYRLNAIGHEFVGLFDGRRTVEEIWTISLERHGDAAPTQQEAIQLIGQLYNSNLLAIDAAPEVEQLLRRGRERLKRKALGQAVGIMYFKIRLFNPDTIVSAIEPVLRPILNRWGMIAWLAMIIFALFKIAPHSDRLFSGVENTVAPSNWLWLGVVFIVTKAIHELGHGVILKRFGGQVPEFGIMLLVLFPAPYVDASAAWALPSKWKRIAVGAGGMIFELFVASIAALVWVATLNTDGSLTHQLAYNAMFVASVSTVLFNANPLMRFDGYYMLSDLMEMPNLQQRSQNMLKYFFKKRVYGLKNESPPATSASERWTLVIYGILSIAYRIFLFFSITLQVMGLMFAVGLLLAIWTAAMWFILPVAKMVHWLASAPNLHDKRARAVATTLAMAAVVLLAVGVIPFPDRRRASGVVEPIARSGVFFGSDGFVVEAFVKPGDRVEAGTVLARLENRDLRSRIAMGRAQIERVESALRQSTLNQPVAVDVYAEQLRGMHEQLAYLEQKVANFEIRAPHAGFVAGADPTLLVGAFVREGQGLCEIIDDSKVRVIASLSQRENSWAVQAAQGALPVTAQVRFYSAVPRAVDADVLELIEAGQSTLVHPSLGYGGGGGIATAPDDRSGLRAASKQFEMRLAPEAIGGWSGAPGERVAVRFTLPSKPLGVQWLDRLGKLLQGRVTL